MNEVREYRVAWRYEGDTSSDSLKYDVVRAYDARDAVYQVMVRETYPSKEVVVYNVEPEREKFTTCACGSRDIREVTCGGETYWQCADCEARQNEV